MVDCVLVYPYIMRTDRTQRKERSPLPPLGLMYLASSMKQAGLSVKVLDCTFMEGLDDATSAMISLDPKVVGIHGMITLTRKGMELAHAAKENGIPVVYGGPDPSLRPEKYLKDGMADFVVFGEGEETGPELIKSIISNGDPRKLEGIAFQFDGKVVRTKARSPVKDIDCIQFPDRDAIDSGLYRRVWLEDHGYAMTSIITTRGCPYGCNYCSNPVAPFGRRYYQRSPGNVADELEEIISKYRYNRVWFADDVLTIVKKRTLELCSEIVNRRLDFTWSCLTRADRVDEEILRAMRSAGCDLIFFGVESGSQRILDLMNRGMKLDHIRRAVGLAKKIGIGVHAFMIMGYPGEDLNSISASISFLKELLPEQFSFTVAYPLPGTTLHNIVEPLSEDAEWDEVSENELIFKSDIPGWVLKFAIWKAKYEVYAARRAAKGQSIFGLGGKVFKAITDPVLSLMVPRRSSCPVADAVIQLSR